MHFQLKNISYSHVYPYCDDVTVPGQLARSMVILSTSAGTEVYLLVQLMSAVRPGESMLAATTS